MIIHCLESGGLCVYTSIHYSILLGIPGYRWDTELNGYGVFKESIRIGEHKIKIQKRKTGVVEYKRSIGEEIVASKIVLSPTRFELLPFYPVFLPKKITTYILVYLAEEIDVPPRKELDLYIKIPVDTAIYAYYQPHRFTIIDIFTENRVKYCLYGPPDRGIIARYAESNLFFKKPECVRGEAIVPLHIRNRLDSWTIIGKILLDSQILKLYYENETWHAYTQHISMVVNSSVTASIYYGRRPRYELKPIHDPPDLRPPRLLAKTEMLWGLK